MGRSAPGIMREGAGKKGERKKFENIFQLFTTLARRNYKAFFENHVADVSQCMMAKSKLDLFLLTDR